MALVLMKRLTAVLPAEERRNVLRRLSRLGCVELERASPELLASSAVLRKTEEESDAADIKAKLVTALVSSRSLTSACTEANFLPGP